MVRRSLVETLSDEAREFLREGRPQPAKPNELKLEKLTEPHQPLDRVFALDIWSPEDRALLRGLFQERYSADLERCGIGVTATGIMEPVRGKTPNTRGLDKDIRVLRREITVLSEVVRQLLRVVVMVGGCRPEQLRDYLAGSQRDAIHPPEPGVAPAAGGATADEKPAEKVPGGRPASSQETPAEGAAAAAAKGKSADREEKAPAGTNGDGEESQYSLSQRLRRGPPEPEAPPSVPFSRFRRKPVERVAVRKPVVKQPVRLKTCPRCKKQVPVRVSRCLACGRSF
jgi:hypothetical protein